MPARLRLYDLRNSRMPQLVGVCQSNVPAISNYTNTAQRRLLYALEAGNDGWNGTFAEVAFSVNRDNPYITTPRGIARIMYATWCDHWVPVQNIFYEYLKFGNGRLPKRFANSCSCIDLRQMIGRNNAVTFTDLSSPPQYIRVRITDATDVGKRAMIGGTDNNDAVIYTQDGLNKAVGVYVPFDTPFVTTTYQFNSISGIQKDVTNGDVQFYQVDPTSGDEVLLLTMEPSETTASYRRYYLSALPRSCCPPPNSTGSVSVVAICKLELIPVTYDTDYLLINEIEALTEECQSVRYSEMDTPSAKQLSMVHHKNAISLLNGELSHYMGQEQPAIGFKPFGSASLSKQRIGSLL